MLSDAISTAIQTLKAERAKLDGAIVALEQAIGVTADVPVAPKKRGRPRGRPTGSLAKLSPTGPARTKTGKAPRGLLKAKMHELLKAAGKPISPAELRDRLVKAGYPVHNPKNFYTQVFTAAGKDPAIKKTADGFSLKAGAEAVATAK
jgi:hypothetical protein